MERLDVVQLQIELEERLPVERALVHLEVIEHVAREIVVGGEIETREIARHVARASEQQPLPRLKRCGRERQLRRLRKLRCAEELAVEVVGPAMDGADDVLHVAASFEQQRLPMAAYV